MIRVIVGILSADALLFIVIAVFGEHIEEAAETWLKAQVLIALGIVTASLVSALLWAITGEWVWNLH